MKQKRVSVIMACYNCEKTLNKAINSILAQTYSDWVMICCDDGSTDGTPQILNNFKSKYPDKFIIIRNERNMKLAYSLNQCLKYVNTDYVARMDADDESFPERFDKQVLFLDTHPEFIVCGTEILIYNEMSGKQYVKKVDCCPDKLTLFRHTPFNHATIMCRREMYSVLEGYRDDKTTVRCEDKDLWYRFFCHNLSGSNLKEPLYKLSEDIAHIKRNTARSRWNGFVTDIHGYKMLKYPWYWYYKPFFSLLKILIPKCIVVLYFKWFRN